MTEVTPQSLEEYVSNLSARVLVKSYVMQRKNKLQDLKEFHQEVYERVLARSGRDIAGLWHLREACWLSGTEDDAKFTAWTLFYLGESGEAPSDIKSEDPGDMSFVTNDPNFGFGTFT